jgi:hypothetical protein
MNENPTNAAAAVVTVPEFASGWIAVGDLGLRLPVDSQG